MKKVLFVVIVAVLALAVSSIGYCAETAKTAKTAAPSSTAAVKRPMPQLNRNFVFIQGSVSKIDITNPNAAKIEVMGETDKQVHTVELGEATNILKGIDASELKTGDKVRIMARKADNKEIALSVVTGKFKELPRPVRPAAPAAIPATTVKKEQPKK